MAAVPVRAEGTGPMPGTAADEGLGHGEPPSTSVPDVPAPGVPVPLVTGAGAPVDVPARGAIPQSSQ